MHPTVHPTRPHPVHVHTHHLVARCSRSRLGISASGCGGSDGSSNDDDDRRRRRCQEVPGDSLEVDEGGGWGGVVQGALVAPYAGVHLTRRWCAAVRRGRHTKSAGYSGHVAGTGSWLSKGATCLPLSVSLPLTWPAPLCRRNSRCLSVGLPHFARSQATSRATGWGSINWLTRRHSLAL